MQDFEEAMTTCQEDINYPYLKGKNKLCRVQ